MRSKGPGTGSTTMDEPPEDGPFIPSADGLAVRADAIDRWILRLTLCTEALDFAVSPANWDRFEAAHEANLRERIAPGGGGDYWEHFKLDGRGRRARYELEARLLSQVCVALIAGGDIVDALKRGQDPAAAQQAAIDRMNRAAESLLPEGARAARQRAAEN